MMIINPSNLTKFPVYSTNTKNPQSKPYYKYNAIAAVTTKNLS